MSLQSEETPTKIKRLLTTEFISWFIDWYKYESKELMGFREKKRLPNTKWKYSCFTRRLLYTMRQLFCWPCCLLGMAGRKYDINNNVIQTADGCLVIFPKEAEQIIGEPFVQLDKDQSKNVRKSILKFIEDWVELLSIYKIDVGIARALSLKIVRLIDLYNDMLAKDSNLRDAQFMSRMRSCSFIANRIRLHLILGEFGEIITLAKGFKDVL